MRTNNNSNAMPIKHDSFVVNPNKENETNESNDETAKILKSLSKLVGAGIHKNPKTLQSMFILLKYCNVHPEALAALILELQSRKQQNA